MDDDIEKMKQERMAEMETREPQVEVFTTSTCPYCTKLKAWLDEQGVDYVEHDVASDREQAMRMIRTTGQQGVPQTFVGDQAIIGFQPQEIAAALEA